MKTLLLPAKRVCAKRNRARECGMKGESARETKLFSSFMVSLQVKQVKEREETKRV